MFPDPDIRLSVYCSKDFLAFSDCFFYRTDIQESLFRNIIDLTIEDKLGQTLFEAPQAWIRKDPDWEDGDDLNSREWTFDTGIAVNLVGGN